MAIKKRLIYFSPLIVFLVASLIFNYFYYHKIGSFGCFDDCFNFMGGYYLLKEKQIFSEFFYNHAPGMAYISFIIQKLSDPQDIYKLILFHRLALFGFTFLMEIILTLKFRWLALFFILLFELTKFYLFGDRFLAENFIVYPLIYTLGVVLQRINKIKPKNYDYILIGIFAWFTIFMREPFTPLVLFLYLIILWNKEDIKLKLSSILIFGVLTLVSLINIPLSDAFFNIVTLNRERSALEISERGGFLQNLFSIFLYPVYVLIEGKESLLRSIQIILSLTFIYIIYSLYKIKEYKQIILIILILGLSNIRYILPGKMYFDAFHITIWYAFIIFINFFYIKKFLKSDKKYWIAIISIIIIAIFSMFSDGSLITKTNNMLEFNNSYANDYAYGSGIKLLSDPNDKLFLEERDDMIYWVSGLDSNYKYQWYTSLMPSIKKYSDERIKMFAENPPEFYYDACFLIYFKNHRAKLDIFNIKYQRIFMHDKPSCLLIRKDKIKEIDDSRWERVRPFGFSK